jgi:hypothetical protein
MSTYVRPIFLALMCAFWIAGPLPSGAILTQEVPAFLDGAALLAAIKGFDKRMSGATDKVNQKIDKTNSKIGESNDKLEQIKRETKEANSIGNKQLAEQWAQRIENWTAHIMRYTKLVQQLTTLRGIYQYTMTKMGLDEKTRANLLKWFKHIEEAKRLYTAGIQLWNTRWAVLDTIQRIRNMPGSFNIREAWYILNDFMDRVYRAEYAAEQKRRVMLERDPKLGLLWEQYGDLQAQLAYNREKIKRVKEELTRMSGDSVSVGTTPPDGQNPVDSNPNTSNTQDQEAMRDLQKRLDDLENQEQVLKAQIADKIKEISDLYGQNRVKFDYMTETAKEIRENDQAWGKLIEQVDADGEKAFRAIMNGPSELPDAPSAPAIGPR